MTFLCAPPCLKVQVITPKMISTTAGGARRCHYGSERASTNSGTASAPTPPSTLLTAVAASFLGSQNRPYRAWGLGELLAAAGGAALGWHGHRLGGDCLNVTDKRGSRDRRLGRSVRWRSGTSIKMGASGEWETTWWVRRKTGTGVKPLQALLTKSNGNVWDDEECEREFTGRN